MKLKGLLFALALSMMLAGCKKDNVVPPSIQVNTTPPPIGTTTPSKLTISNVLQSNMVVQRNKPLKLWGTAPAGVKIAVKVSWYTDSIRTAADANGKWQVTIPAAAANANAQNITTKTNDSNHIVLNNILIGDVWICSGQSNMVMEVDSIPPFRGVTNYQAEIAAANYPTIRALTLQSDFTNSLSDTLNYPGKWAVCSPATVGNISGVAFYFARKLTTQLNVPIGIIVSAVNGTSCEAWIDRKTFINYADLLSYSNINSATMLYNGMINPFINLSITGFIWYQGENNRHNNPPSDYTNLNSALIQGWRSAFNQGQLPFYYVQMPPFAVDYYNTKPLGGDITLNDYAKFREAQANVLNVPGTGMAITMDVGELRNQHPQNKKPVGERLALLALKNTYNKDVQCYGPRYSSFSTNANRATITFVAGTANGLNTIDNSPLKQYFFVAGANQVFYEATALISGSQVILTAPSSVATIQAIRYAFTNAPVTNLQNSAELPMEPFRTDNWVN
jgi:sialate O-acetylesterase